MGAELLTAAVKFIKGLPTWAYVFLGLLIIVAFGYFRIAGERDEARRSLAAAQDTISRLEGDNRTLKSNNAELEVKLKAQSASIEAAKRAADAAQSAGAAALEAERKKTATLNGKIAALEKRAPPMECRDGLESLRDLL